MRPIDLVRSRIPTHSASGTGYSACCPAHEDRSPSLSFSEAEDGKVLIQCHAGCSLKAVLASIELTQSDLFPKDFLPAKEPKVTQSLFPSLDKAIAAYGWGQPCDKWEYLNADGSTAGWICRWDLPSGKEYRPVSPRGTGWATASMPCPRPLFNMRAISEHPDAVIYVVEGEKCVDAMAVLGLVATTSAHGARSAKQSDWQPLAGRQVVCLPDNDEEGEFYAASVGQALGTLGSTIRVLRLDGLQGGDVADLLDDCISDVDIDSLKTRIEQLAAEAKELEISLPSAASTSEYEPFPVDQLPEPISSFVTEAASTIGCDPSFIALPVLTQMGAAIGTSRRLFVKKGYEVYPILWTGIVGESGTAKTPALKIALASSHSHEMRLRSQANPRRCVAADATPESLAELMAANPRGIFTIRDELAGWLGGIDQYAEKKGGCSPHQAFLLSCYDGVAHSVDRRTKAPLYIPHAALWVTGGIQPGTLRRAMGQAQRESGLLARLLLAAPPASPQKFTDEEISDATSKSFEGVMDRLRAIEGDQLVHLSPTGKEAWRQFNDKTAEESLALSGDLSAAWSKFRQTALRLALIFHLSRGEECDVSEDSMTQAIAVTNWFKHETQRVYEDVLNGFNRQAITSDEDRLAAWLRSRGPVSPRKVQAGCRWLQKPNEARNALERLMADGRVRKTDHGEYELAS